MNPIYYVFFTTATIIASAILFSGFNTPGGVNTVSLICGFLVIFMGVYLLNVSREPNTPHKASTSLETGFMSELHDSLRLAQLTCSTDPRMSMSGRLSLESNGGNGWNYASVPNLYAPSGNLQSPSHGRRSSIYRAQNSTLFSAFEEDGVALSDLPEESESDEEARGVDGGRTDGRSGGQNRSLVGAKGKREGEVNGGLHPAYASDGR